MPTLEELRDWLSGEAIEGLPAQEEDRSEDPIEDAKESTLVDKLKKSRKYHSPEGRKSPRFYALIDDYALGAGLQNAELTFGKHRGEKLSDLAFNNPDYLRWIIAEDFPEAFQELCQGWLELTPGG